MTPAPDPTRRLPRAGSGPAAPRTSAGGRRRAARCGRRAGARALLFALLPAAAALAGCSSVPSRPGSPSDTPKVTVRDEFERARLGPDWTVYNGDVGIVGGSDLGVITRTESLLGLGVVAWSGDPFPAGQFAEIVVSPDVPPALLIQVFVRRRPGDGRRYGFHWQDTGGGEWVLKRDGGTDAPVLSVQPGAKFRPGDTLRIEAVGDTIRGFRNGTLLVEAVDAALSGPGEPGVALNVAAGPVPDDAFPVAGVESWEAGGL